MSTNEKNYGYKPKTQTARRSKTPRKRLSESEGDGLCVVCAHPVEIYAIGHCDHFICFKCSTKLRLLCEETFCPVCRKDLKKVIFAKTKATFAELNNLKLVKDKEYDVGLFFADISIIKDYQKIIEHRCPICKDRPPDKTFEGTRLHLRKEHKLFYCEICLEHNRTFTSECKVYDRKDLATHKRMGDSDDTSHRGHPLCQYCDVRYLDDDKLFHHLRTTHYYCHLCDNGESNEFYGTYPDLRCHYKKEHFLCEIDGCAEEEFTSVFGSELDYKAHCASVHKENKTKQQQKMDRQIDLGFQYTRRNPPPSRGNRHHSPAERRPRSQHSRRHDNQNYSDAFEREGDLEKALQLSQEDAEKVKVSAETSSAIDSKAVGTKPIGEEPSVFHQSVDFPKLDSTSSKNTSKSLEKDKSPPIESKTEAKSENTDLLWTKNASLKSAIQSKEEFPSLSSIPVASVAVPTWGNSKPARMKKAKPKASATKTPFSNNSNSSQPITSHFTGKQKAKPVKKSYKNNDDDFPTLNAMNTVLVGRGSAKHMESYESFSSGQASNVKLVSYDTAKGVEIAQKSNEPKYSNSPQDFPSSASHSGVSAPPGFTVKSQKEGHKSNATSSQAFEIGDSQADFPNLPLSNHAKPSRAPPGFSALSNQPKKEQKAKLKNASQQNDLTDVKQRNQKVVGYSAVPQNNHQFKPLSGFSESENAVQSSDALNEVATQSLSHSKASKKKKGFSSKNLDEDFPSLSAQPMPQAFNAPPPNFNKPNTKKENSRSNSDNLSLANVFDYPSL